MDKGIIQILVILVLFVIILSFLGISLGAIFKNELVRDNFAFIWKWAKQAWDWSVYAWGGYLSYPIKITWKIFIEYAWKPFAELF
ncbi:MAG: hypothetical protein A2909_00185 [Candidatus Tagabacteria bacterium RIFCSPLOWO2_01_FULL_39_11]|uniref:Uncharacterized protein n=1 Tax=Candidatus Tagabacteria bacterium RIFCSPLOWO2_01_FULL_39_11 TaxID=1802295 RepID=A0A1G2LPX9_9BACT|nr:MAG: hypothetical protein A2909_00185 [Candidatus Tagabacteria bacterium RIFCSPLOWO2_01_FULL_39_11]